ncbi:MAG: hypothetical protein EBZ77_01850 [Chitinophagia bacterium]|nr:hypothetical protein [Chitinophagia bacterium]
MKPPLTLALTIAIASVAAPALAAKPACWQVQPGPTPDPAKVAWWTGGKKLLDTPASWDVQRVYQELQSYGFCVINPGSNAETSSGVPVLRVRSSSEIIKENLEKEKVQDLSNTGSISWPTLLFLVGAGIAVFRAVKDDDSLLDKEKKEKDNRFFSGISQPSPWLADQILPVPASLPSSAPSPSSEPDAPVMREPPEPTSSQWFGRKFGKSSDGSEPGSEKSSEKVRSFFREECLRAIKADSPYCIDDDDTFVKSVIRLAIKAGLKKGETMGYFYWLKPQGDNAYVKTIISKGENKNYERFNELYAEVEYSDRSATE